MLQIKHLKLFSQSDCCLDLSRVAKIRNKVPVIIPWSGNGYPKLRREY